MPVVGPGTEPLPPGCKPWMEQQAWLSISFWRSGRCWVQRMGSLRVVETPARQLPPLLWHLQAALQALYGVVAPGALAMCRWVRAHPGAILRETRGAANTTY